VEIPAIYLWIAGKLAERAGDAERTKLITNTIASSRPGGEKSGSNVSEVLKLRQFSALPPASTYIPFVRSPLDTFLAAHLFGAGCCHFKLYSEASMVDLGYVRVAAGATAYVDKRSETKRFDGNLSDPYGSSQVDQILKLANSYAGSDMKLRVDHRDNRILSVVGDLNSLAMRVDRWPASCALSILTGPDPGMTGTLMRKFGSVLLERQSDWELSLAGLTAEQAMELTAASLVGKWIQLEHDSFRFLGKLPDLTESDFTQALEFDPFFQFLPYSLEEKARR
jgi:hypothetical protein